jgi:hypothetical protein
MIVIFKFTRSVITMQSTHVSFVTYQVFMDVNFAFCIILCIQLLASR